MQDGITIIYDGHCPFCSSYVSMVRLRETVGQVDLIDARSDAPSVLAALSAGYDLDKGMLVTWEGTQFFGQDAVHLLATLSAPSGSVNNLQRILFASPHRAALLYPVLASGRRLFLRIFGRQTIAHERKNRAPTE